MSDDIFTAAEKNNTKRLETFLSDGVDPNTLDNERGSTHLYWACAKGNIDAIEILLEYGADVNHQNKHGRTGLHALVSERYDKIALWLVEYCNADPHIADKRGVSPFDLCQKFFQPEMEAALKNRGKQKFDDVQASESESSDDDFGPGESIPFYNAAHDKYKELHITPPLTAQEVILSLVESLGWPKPYARYIELLEHVTKVVGQKRMKKERITNPGDKVLALKAAWPMLPDKSGVLGHSQSWFLFRVSPSAPNVPTQLHVLYGQI